MLKCRSFLYIFFRSFLPEFPRGRLLTLAPLPIHFLWCSPQDTQVPSSKIVQNMQSNIMLLKVFLSFSFDVRRSMQPSSKLNTAMVPLARLSKVTKHRLLGGVQNLKRDNKWLWQPVSSRCSWFPLKENGCFLLKSGAAYFELKRAGTWFDYFHLQGLQERPIPASLPSHPPWTWHLRKPNTSGTGIWSYCCFSPWDNLCKDFTFSEIHSGPCLAAGCSALALWVRPSRLKLYSALWRKVDSSSVEKSRLKLHSAQWRKVDQNFKLPHLLAIYRGKATKSREPVASSSFMANPREEKISAWKGFTKAVKFLWQIMIEENHTFSPHPMIDGCAAQSMWTWDIRDIDLSMWGGAGHKGSLVEQATFPPVSVTSIASNVHWIILVGEKQISSFVRTIKA